MKYRYNWLRSPTDLNDHAYRRTGAKVHDRMNLSPLMGAFYDQGQEGSCTGNALARVCKFLWPGFEPSREFIYDNELITEHNLGHDAGAYGRDGVKSLAKIGVCPEKDWPYRGKVSRVKPPAQAYADAAAHKIKEYMALHTIEDMLDCLASGFPFVFGLTVFDSFESEAVAKSGIVPIPKAGEKEAGGHEIVGSGADVPNRMLKIDNSWGGHWGDHGSAWIPFDYITNRKIGADDIWTLRK